ncbi:transposase [Mycobacterium sp. 29Ha]|uniref:transposase n=1 Tax=Mycobacterium sp. 29Ha TaxID=2939268 RepID=UPI0029392C9E|nr:transposase [Mycobacterium sp. 29Ha]MDV3134386.1 transposase [Mycobacterium sp. 29Ha]
MAETFTAETPTAELDSLIKDAVKEGTTIDGADGLRNELTKAVLERALNSELTHIFGYEAGDPAGPGSGILANGTTPKTVTTFNGRVKIDSPRDRTGRLIRRFAAKKDRRFDSINSIVLSLYPRGIATPDIMMHLAEVYACRCRGERISNFYRGRGR